MRLLILAVLVLVACAEPTPVAPAEPSPAARPEPERPGRERSSEAPKPAAPEPLPSAPPEVTKTVRATLKLSRRGDEVRVELTDGRSFRGVLRTVRAEDLVVSPFVEGRRSSGRITLSIDQIRSLENPLATPQRYREDPSSR